MRKNRIFYGIYLIVILYLSMIYFDYGLYVIFYSSLLIPVFALIYSLCLRKKVVFAWGRMETNVTRGSKAGIALGVRNLSMLPTGVTEICFSGTDVLLNSTIQKKKRIALCGHETTTESLTIQMNHSGMMRVSVNSVRVCEPLGLFSHTIRLNLDPLTYIVMPDICEPETMPWEHNPYAYVEEEVYSAVKPGDDPSELFGVREYMPGDKQNRVHWNLTAKQDEMMVKQLGLPIDCAALVLLELHKPDNDVTADVLYDTAFSLSLKLVLTGHRHWFAWMDGERSTLFRELVEDEEQVYALIPRVFAACCSREDCTITNTYYANYPRERFRNIFFVSADIGDNDRRNLKELAGDAYVVCYIANQEITGKNEREWKEIGVRSGHVAEDLCGTPEEVSAYE